MPRIADDMIDLFAAIIVIFLFPLLYFGQKQDSLIQAYDTLETNSLVNEIRSSGYLTKDRYDRFLSSLSNTGLLYEVSIRHKQAVNEPEYRFRTDQEVIDEQDAAYTGGNPYTYTEVTTDIPEVNDPVNTGPLNTETNESILASAVNTPASANHVHTEECYSGHRHTALSSTPFTHHHAHTYSCQLYTSYAGDWATCNNCGSRYQDYWYSAYWNTTSNSVQVIGAGNLSCDRCGSTSKRDQEFFQSFGYSCYYDKDLDGDGWTDQIERGITYEYMRSSPMPAEISQDYVDGCYTYHTHGIFPEEQSGYYYTYFLSPENVFQKLYQNPGRYCRIPARFEFRLYRTYDSDSPYISVYYKPVKVNGNIIFNFGGPGNGMHILENSFPSGLTSAYMANLRYSWNLGPFMNTYIQNKQVLSFNPLDGQRTGIGTSTIYDPQTGTNIGTSIICNKAADRWVPSCNQEQDETLDCNEIITGITATNPIQTVAVGDPLITTVTAAYTDGSAKVVAGTTNFTTTAPIQNQTVTITYNYLIDGTVYSKTCNIIVTVIRRSRTCTNGHTYNLNSDGTDPGCPYCKAWLQSLTITYPRTGSVTIFKGTSLSDNGVELLATYLDGHTEQLSHEYTDNLDPNYVGTQNVTLSYKGKYVTLTVITKRVLKQCSVCSRFYELYPDLTDPGCPYCAARTPVFTGNVMKYFTEFYTRDILKELYEGSGIYYFTNGDFISIHVSNSRKSLSGRLLGHIFKSLNDDGIQLLSSGYIREDETTQ